MLVKAYTGAHEHTGLYVGEKNARRYFRKRAQSIDLLLDDLRIRCTLSPDFWEGHPEIHDARLNEWLDFKDVRERPSREPMMLTMLPSGENTYVVRTKAPASAQSFGAEVNLPRPVKSASLFSRGPALVLGPQSA